MPQRGDSILPKEHSLLLKTRLMKVLQNAGDSRPGVLNKIGAFCPAAECLDPDSSAPGTYIEKDGSRNLHLQDIEQGLLDLVLCGTGIQPVRCYEQESSRASRNHSHFFHSFRLRLIRKNRFDFFNLLFLKVF
jgi:hypothetical protein